MTPIQAGLETDHDQLEFDFVARPHRVRKPVHYAYTLKSADFENLKLQIMQSSAISNSVSCNYNRKLQEYHTSLGDSLKVNPKRCWSYFRHKTKSNSIPANVTHGGRQISSGVKMAEVFNKYFYSTFTHAPEVPLNAFTPPDEGMPVLDSLVVRSIRCS